MIFRSGKQLKETREKLNLTRKQLAKRRGVSLSTVYRSEKLDWIRNRSLLHIFYEFNKIERKLPKAINGIITLEDGISYKLRTVITSNKIQL